MSGTHRKLSIGGSKSSAGSFYIVGGPVQPDRPCYIMRKADDQIFSYLRDNEYCYVLGSRQQGKSSLMAATARRLSDKDELVSVVDLTQVISQQAGTDPSRWFYGIAYRIVRDLRLRVNLQSWWQERGALTMQHRLVDFFWEIVLANTVRPITVFFDEIEDTLGLPFAEEFFTGLRVCHNSRAAEPDFDRLRFVIIGVSTPTSLCPNQAHAPFSISRQIDLNDFTMTEACGLLPGLNLAKQQAAQAMERILYWTGGHPYLTQKLCRAVSRREVGEKVASTVDDIVNDQFLARNRAREEPHLAMIRRRLSTRQDAAALTVYGKLCKGKVIAHDPQSRVHQALCLTGLVRANQQRQLIIRNRIYQHVFTPRWVNHELPFEWKGFAKAAAAALALLAAPLWYTQVLPRPYIETLSAATEDYQLAMTAYNDLRSIPGYKNTADRLLSGVLMRRSLRATTLPLAMEADQGLRTLPDNSALADQLLAGFWDRQAQQAEQAEQRDAALLYRLSSLIDDRVDRRRQISELVGADYPVLATTIRPVGALMQAAISKDGGRVSTLTDDGSLQVWDTRTGTALKPAPVTLTAEEYVGLDREILVALEGLVRGISLELRTDHPDPAQLAVQITSPQGTRVVLQSSAARRIGGGLMFDARSHGALAVFSRENMHGDWQLRVEDHQKQIQGNLLGWRLIFAGYESQPQQDMLSSGIILPQPHSTERTGVVLSQSGRYAAAYGGNPDLGGLVNIQDLHEDLQLSRPVREAGMTPLLFADEDRLLVAMSASGDRLLAWNISDGSIAMDVPALDRFVGPPLLDPMAGLMMAVDHDRQGLPLVRVFGMADRSELSQIPFAREPRGLAIDPQGRWLASSTGSRAVEIWDLVEDELLDEYLLDFPVSRLTVDARGRWLAATGTDGQTNIRDVSGGMVRSLQTILDEPDALVFHPAADSVLILRHGAWQLVGLPGGESLSPPLRYTKSGRSLAAVSRDSRLMTGSQGSALRLWQIPESGERSGRDSRYGSGDNLSAVRIGRDGGQLAVGLPDGGIRYWRATDEGVVSNYLAAGGAFSAAITAMAFDAAGNRLATIDQTGAIRVIDLDSDASRPVGSQPGAVNHLVFNADGSRLAAAGDLGARLWFLDRPGESVQMGSEDSVSHLAFSPDGNLLAVTPELGELSVWHTMTGESVGGIRSLEQVRVAVFSPDQTALATGSQDGTLQFWSLTDGSTVWPPVRLGGPIRELTYTAGGQSLVAISDGWAHQITLPFSGPRVVQSRLLPERIPHGGFYLSGNDAAVSVEYLDWVNGERHEILSLRLDNTDLSAWPGDVDKLSSGWQDKLHLMIDAEGQLIAGQSVLELSQSIEQRSTDIP
jgi:WD40 repeat protein